MASNVAFVPFPLAAESGNGDDPSWFFPAEDLTLPLSALHARAARMAAGLAEHGVGQGDRVVTMLENGSGAVCLLLALWRLGAVPIPLRPASGRPVWLAGYLDMINRIGKAALLVHGETQPPPVPEGLRTVTPGDLEAWTTSPPPPVGAGPDAESLALVQFTSGSTGQPKGVMVTWRMVATQVRQLADNYAAAGVGAGGGKGEGPRSAASWLPVYHDMGLFIGLLLPLHAGAAAMLAPPAFYMRNPARWFSLMAARRVDVTFSTNSVLAATLRGLRRLEHATCDLSSLVLYIAAEKISPRVVDRVAEVLGPLGLAPHNTRAGYGMAEYALGCTHTRGGTIRRLTVRRGVDGRLVPLPVAAAGTPAHEDSADVLELVSVGVPNEGCTIAIRDGMGQVLGDLCLGEITLSGPCLTPGYLDDAEATARVLGTGWLRTGDLGFLYGGELYFVSRADEMMKVAGRTVIPTDVELAVESLTFVGPGRAVLFGVEEEGLARQVLLIEALPGLSRAERAARVAALRRRVLEEFGFAPSHITLVPRGTVEKTSSGKKRTAVIRDRWRSGAIAEVPLEGVRAVTPVS